MAGPPEPVVASPPVREGADEGAYPYPSFADPAAVAAIVGGYHSAPFDILGMHLQTVDGKPSIVIRTFQPQALAVSVIRRGKCVPDGAGPSGRPL